MQLDPDACYRALTARDARFDGAFFVAVKTTGIYCRPICRARRPGRDRCVFYRRAIEAERDGFRACFRCRPERAPGSRFANGLSKAVASAVARIESGALNEGSVEELASGLGITARHLRRAMQTELGVSPLELALSKRIALARELLFGTALPVTDVAHASGFGSLRRFNAAFRAHQGRAPSELRRSPVSLSVADGTVRVTLEYRPPFDWAAMLAFFAARAVRGVESVANGVYRRTVTLGLHRGFIAVSPSRGAALNMWVSDSLIPSLAAVVPGARRLFDLDADPLVIADHLAADPILAPLCHKRPGLRLPGALDPFEIGVRAVLGQQVSVAHARTLAARLVERFGDAAEGARPELNRYFPAPEAIARAKEHELVALGLPTGRARSLHALARAVHDRSVPLHSVDLADPEVACAALATIPGVGPWTRQYIAMRGLSWPDAFPEGDLGIRKALGGITAAACLKLAEHWRPWRAYAAIQLWASL